MNLTGAMVAYLLWFVAVAAAFVVAGGLVVKQGGRGVVWGLVTVVGALLMFAFVSAVTGLYEIPNSLTHTGFLISVGVGVLGAGLFGAGCLKLRGRNAR